ncbi:hypothetical protein CFOL_v3_23007 [Cephalotus follicularis]|uniref:Uncharacterized protein n=1 Tax=Cephalotus follicularis TaxID=3775 RepID=A0A1Q3CHF3_CEPFO|nr:hypothetical protein CFOL_v3_23007 [Cephalotus follicularis]
MEETGPANFPGFQTGIHKDEFVCRMPLSRLQRRAPYPIQIKPDISLQFKGASKVLGSNINSSSTSSSIPSSTFNSYFHGKDPIPLLSPLVLPSLLESVDNAKSHLISL